MIILFTLWYILQWQFPTWLWVMSGFFYVVSLRPKKKRSKKVSISTSVLPFYLALAIIFGTDVVGNAILPEHISYWTIIGILIGSSVIRLIVLRPDRVIKKEMSKIKDVDSDKNVNITLDGEGVILDESDDDLKLHIEIKNKKKNKTSNVKINLNNGFIKEKFIQNFVLKGIKKSWEASDQYTDDDGTPLFDIEEIYNKAKENPVRGEILSIDNDKVSITVSIK